MSTDEKLSFNTYLGLPVMVGLDRSDSFTHLVKRIVNRLKGWKKEILSLDGKKSLLKAVIQSIPVFAMAVFNIPKKVCKEITDAMAGSGGAILRKRKKM